MLLRPAGGHQMKEEEGSHSWRSVVHELRPARTPDGRSRRLLLFDPPPPIPAVAHHLFGCARTRTDTQRARTTTTSWGTSRSIARVGLFIRTVQTKPKSRRIFLPPHADLTTRSWSSSSLGFAVSIGRGWHQARRHAAAGGV